MRRLFIFLVCSFVLNTASALAQDPGVDNGRLLAPELYFQEAIRGIRPATDWIEVLTNADAKLNKYGLGQQKGSAGNVRARLFLPNAGCPNAAPDPNDPQSVRFGVRQVPACWDTFVDVIGDGPVWQWRQSGPAYIPCVCGSVDPGPVPAPPPVVDLQPILDRLTALEQRLSDVLVLVRKHEEVDIPAARERLFMLETKPIPMECQVSAFGIHLSCRLK